MKSIFLIFCTGLLLSVSAQAQKKKSSVKIQVPEAINSSFKSMYSASESSNWNRNYNGNYVVNFTNADNQEQAVEYSDRGNVVKTKTFYKTENMPVNIVNAVSAKYPEAKISTASRLELQGVAPYYNVKIEKTDGRMKTIFISEEGIIAE